MYKVSNNSYLEYSAKRENEYRDKVSIIGYGNELNNIRKY